MTTDRHTGVAMIMRDAGAKRSTNCADTTLATAVSQPMSCQVKFLRYMDVRGRLCLGGSQSCLASLVLVLHSEVSRACSRVLGGLFWIVFLVNYK